MIKITIKIGSDDKMFLLDKDALFGLIPVFSRLHQDFQLDEKKYTNVGFTTYITFDKLLEKYLPIIPVCVRQASQQIEVNRYIPLWWKNPNVHYFI